MSKRSAAAKARSTIKKTLNIVKEDKDCQTDQLLQCLLDVSIADKDVPTTSTRIQDFTKEQLATRLACSQSAYKRLMALLMKERSLRKDEQQNFSKFVQEIKVTLYESRHSYSIIKKELADSTIAFLNGREALRGKLETFQEKCQTDLREMKDQVARNDVVIEKANITITTTKKKVEETLKQLEETRQKIQKTMADKGFIEEQYKELVKKQNEKYFSSDMFCPKCSAIKKCLAEVTDELKKVQTDRNKLEKENQANASQRIALEEEYKALQKTHEKVVYERNIYKQDDKTLRDQLVKAKKALSETSNSPNRAKLLEMLNSPARLDYSPLLAKETPTKSETNSPTQPEKAAPPAEPQQPKKRTNGEKKLSREEGEVVTPEEEKSNSPAPAKPAESRKRHMQSPKKKAKAKQIDYVYIINEHPTEKKLPKTEPKPSPNQAPPHPLSGYMPRPSSQPRRQSPTYRFDSSNPSSSHPYYADYPRMPPRHPQQHPQQPPYGYPPQRQMPNGYSPQYPPYHQQQQQPPPMLHQQPQPQHPGGNHYYRPATSVNGGLAPWHEAANRPPPSQSYPHPQQRPPGESWTAWR